ncbi:MAG: hypothetical protein DRP62_04635 [Planctomycetota bacterium]|nr:MAG: hypothetical protein DRP62_04635 [Planctomycetota bacterium]
MNEREIVKLFLENGFQISVSALSLVKEDPEGILHELKKLRPRPFIVTENHVKKIINEAGGKKPQIKILKEFHLTKKPIKIEDYTKHFLSRYEKMRNILLKHTSLKRLISINKITPKTQDFSIIGLVREKKTNSLLVEDPTGEIHVFFEDNMKTKFDEIFLDDVIGLKCKRVGEKFYADTVIFPDIPLDRKIHKTENEMKIMVVSNPSTLNDESYQKLVNLANNTKHLSSIFIFWNEDVESLEELSKFNLINIPKKFSPTIFQVSNVNILAIPKHFFNGLNHRINKNILTSMLKKRHVLPTFDLKVHVDTDNLILESVPDIIVSNMNEGFYKNYKGTTIVSNKDAHKIFIIDLKTREVDEKTI